MTSPLAAAASEYRAAGWPVFILGRTKRPVANCPPCAAAGDDHDREACACLLCHGFYRATLDPDRFEAMARAVPRGMLAIRTGAPSGLVVVDIDPDHGGRVDTDLMPRTRTVVTGSGGYHLYYRHLGGTPAPNSASRLGPGIDVRGTGGYVVAPPSVHPRTGRPYRLAVDQAVTEMPRGLLSRCLPPPAPPLATGSAATVPAGDIRHPDRLLDANLAAVARAPEGRRRVVLYGAARGVARMVLAGAVDRASAWAALTAAGRDAGQTERETRAAIVGGFRSEGVSA